MMATFFPLLRESHEHKKVIRSGEYLGWIGLAVECVDLPMDDGVGIYNVWKPQRLRIRGRDESRP
jgi:hypothetical protein